MSTPIDAYLFTQTWIENRYRSARDEVANVGGIGNYCVSLPAYCGKCLMRGASFTGYRNTELWKLQTIGKDRVDFL